MDSRDKKSSKLARKRQARLGRIHERIWRELRESFVDAVLFEQRFNPRFQADLDALHADLLEQFEHDKRRLTFLVAGLVELSMKLVIYRKTENERLRRENAERQLKGQKDQHAKDANVQVPILSEVGAGEGRQCVASPADGLHTLRGEPPRTDDEG